MGMEAARSQSLLAAVLSRVNRKGSQSVLQSAIQRLLGAVFLTGSLPHYLKHRSDRLPVRKAAPRTTRDLWGLGLVPTACSVPGPVSPPLCHCSQPAESKSDGDPTRVLFGLSGHTKAHSG